MVPRPGVPAPPKQPVAVLAGPVRHVDGPALAKWSKLGRLTKRHVVLRACRLDIFAHAGARAPVLFSAPTAGGSLTAHASKRETILRVGGGRVTLQWPDDRQFRACRAAFEFSNRKVEDFFKIVPHRPLGTARAAEVVFAFDVAAGTHAAVKVVSKTRAKSAERVFAEREVALRMTLRHPSVVQTLDIFESPFDLFVVMEFMGGGSLAHKLAADRHPLAESEANAVMRQVLEALGYLHAQGVAHRNVKPENILLDCADGVGWPESAKLADLSLAAPIGARDPARALVGTPEFLAPEVAAVQRGPAPRLCAEADLWAAGVTLYFLLSRTLPFDGADASAVLRKVRSAKFDFSPVAFQGVSPAAKSIIRALLQPSRRKRPTAAAALLHPWFAGPARCVRPAGGEPLFRAAADAVRALLRLSKRCKVSIVGARGGRSVTTISGGVDVAPRAKLPIVTATYGLPARMPPSRISNSSTVGRSSTGSAREEQPPSVPFFYDEDEYSSPAKRANSNGMLSRVSKIKRAISFRGYEPVVQPLTPPAQARRGGGGSGDAEDRKAASRSTFSSHPALRLRKPVRPIGSRGVSQWEQMEGKSDRKWRLRDTWEARAQQNR